MGRPANGWTAARPNWNGVLGMYWRVPGPIPPRTFYPSTWKPVVPGKTYTYIPNDQGTTPTSTPENPPSA